MNNKKKIFKFCNVLQFFVVVYFRVTKIRVTKTKMKLKRKTFQ